MSLTKLSLAGNNLINNSRPEKLSSILHILSSDLYRASSVIRIVSGILVLWPPEYLVLYLYVLLFDLLILWASDPLVLHFFKVLWPRPLIFWLSPYRGYVFLTIFGRNNHGSAIPIFWKILQYLGKVDDPRDFWGIISQVLARGKSVDPVVFINYGHWGV
jgi:hypothetical protein